MKKMMIILLVLVVVVPVIATEVKVEQVGSTSTVKLKYLSAPADANRPRAFGLNITTDQSRTMTGFTASKNGESNPSGKGYGIFPGQIAIDASGAVTSWGSPLASGDTTNSVIVELGSLYSGGGNEPATTGDLLTFTVSGDCNVTLSLNSARGGAIKENGNQVNPTITSAIVHVVSDCLKNTDPGYTQWVGFGKPNCWCFKRQCRGDTDGTVSSGRPVYTLDLNLFKLAYNKTDTILKNVSSGGIPGICADNDHIKGSGRQVYTSDLSTFKVYYNKTTTTVPECPNTYINFWTN